MGRAVLAVTDRSLTRRLVTKTRPGRALSTRFVAGEDLDAATEVTRSLNAMGASVSLDLLGEHVTDRASAAAATDDYLECLDRIAAEEVDANISVKLTQLGMGSDNDAAENSLGALAARAAEIGTTVTVDMEESAFTHSTIAIFEQVQAKHGNLGIALQAYLRRTPDDVERLLDSGGHVRLCKGAYAEPSRIAFQSTREVDEAFDQLAARLMSSAGIMPAIATHDTERIAPVRDAADQRAGPWEFQMLYGVRTRLQRQLIADGHALRVYVPFGVAWYPYLTRRLAERPANLWFFLRAAAGR